jgi:hypothetical protein
MKWLHAALVIAACHGEAPANPEYARDIATLCDVVCLSGADRVPAQARGPMIAMWLGPHLKTEQAHDFLVSIQPLEGEPKARALESEAHRAGLSGCALAAEWR